MAKENQEPKDGILKQRRVKAASGDDRREDGGPPGGVPQVRGDGKPDSEPSVRGVRLSRVQPSDPDPKPQEISPSAQEVAPGPGRIASYSELDLEDRIVVLNELRGLLRRGIKVKNTNGRVAGFIRDQYQKWVESQIKHALGSQSDGSFTPDEISILKAFASKIASKQKEIIQSTQTQPPQPPPQQPQPPQPPPPQPRAPVQPLKDSVNVDKLVRAQREFLLELEKMDRESPEF